MLTNLSKVQLAKVNPNAAVLERPCGLECCVLLSKTGVHALKSEECEQSCAFLAKVTLQNLAILLKLWCMR